MNRVDNLFPLKKKLTSVDFSTKEKEVKPSGVFEGDIVLAKYGHWEYLPAIVRCPLHGQEKDKQFVRRINGAKKIHVQLLGNETRYRAWISELFVKSFNAETEVNSSVDAEAVDEARELLAETVDDRLAYIISIKNKNAEIELLPEVECNMYKTEVPDSTTTNCVPKSPSSTTADLTTNIGEAVKNRRQCSKQVFYTGSGSDYEDGANDDSDDEYHPDLRDLSDEERKALRKTPTGGKRKAKAKHADGGTPGKKTRTKSFGNGRARRKLKLPTEPVSFGQSAKEGSVSSPGESAESKSLIGDVNSPDMAKSPDTEKSLEAVKSESPPTSTDSTDCGKDWNTITSSLNLVTKTDETVSDAARKDEDSIGVITNVKSVNGEQWEDPKLDFSSLMNDDGDLFAPKTSDPAEPAKLEKSEPETLPLQVAPPTQTTPVAFNIIPSSEEVNPMKENFEDIPPAVSTESSMPQLEGCGGSSMENGGSSSNGSTLPPPVLVPSITVQPEVSNTQTGAGSVYIDTALDPHAPQVTTQPVNIMPQIPPGVTIQNITPLPFNPTPQVQNITPLACNPRPQIQNITPIPYHPTPQQIARPQRPPPATIRMTSPRFSPSMRMAPPRFPPSPRRMMMPQINRVTLRGKPQHTVCGPQTPHPWYCDLGINQMAGFRAGSLVHYTLSFLQPQKLRDANMQPKDSPYFDVATLHVPDSYLRRAKTLMRQWWRAKAKHFDTIFFVKDKGSYDLFHMDAVIAAYEFRLAYQQAEFAMVKITEANYEPCKNALMAKRFKVARIEVKDPAQRRRIRQQSRPKSAGRRQTPNQLGMIDLTSDDDDDVEEIVESISVDTEEPESAEPLPETPEPVVPPLTQAPLPQPAEPQSIPLDEPDEPAAPPSSQPETPVLENGDKDDDDIVELPPE